MKLLFLMTIALIPFTLACGPKVRMDRDFDFARVKTYTWLEPDPAKDRLYRNLKPARVIALKNMTKQALSRKGLSDQTQADVSVLFYLEAGRGVRTATVTGKPILGVGELGIGTSETAGFLDGDLVFEFYAAEQMIWRGKTKVDANHETASGRRKIAQTIEHLLQGFPAGR